MYRPNVKIEIPPAVKLAYVAGAKDGCMATAIVLIVLFLLWGRK